jgi:hypothetical protein
VNGRSDVVVFSALNNKAGQRIGTQLQVCSVANDEDRGTRGDGGCDASQAVTFAMRESNVETAREFTDYTPRSGSMQPGARAAGDEAITFHVVDSPEPGALLLVGLGLLSLAAVRVRV